MKSFFCIILILLAAIKKCKWNSDFTHYLLQDDTNITTIRPSNFRPIVIKAGNFLSTALSGGSKVNRVRRALTTILWSVSKSVSDIWIQQGIAIQKILGLWDFSHPVFGRFVLKMSYKTAERYYGKYIPNGAYLQLEAIVSPFLHPSTHRVLFHSGLSLIYPHHSSQQLWFDTACLLPPGFSARKP